MNFQVDSSSIIKNGANWYLHGGNRGDLFAVTAEWCGHCKHLKENVALAQKQKRFGFYNLDGDANSKLTQLMGIHGYPTCFKIEQGGKLTPYTGDRSTETLVKEFGN